VNVAAQEAAPPVKDAVQEIRRKVLLVVPNHLHFVFLWDDLRSDLLQFVGLLAGIVNRMILPDLCAVLWAPSA
jgi:hypothetical protein